MTEAELERVPANPARAAERGRTVRPTRLGAVCTAFLAMACGAPSGGPARPTSAAPPAPMAPAETTASGPPWRVHPPALGLVRDGAWLGEGRWLLVDDRGRRWLVRPEAVHAGAPTPERYWAEAAIEQTAAPLVAVTRDLASAGYLLLDSRGDLYRAASPLGALSSLPRPSERLVELLRADDAVIGLDWAGATLRWQPSSGWSAVAVGEPLFDVAVAADGTALGLAMPEALVESGDGGRTWRRVAGARTTGARRLAAAKSGGVLVRGLTGDALWPGFGRTVVASAPDELLAWPGDSDASVVAAAAGPSAAALGEGSAALSGTSYYAAIEATSSPELATVAATSTRWIWASGTLTEPLDLRPLALAEPCDSVHLAARGPHLLLGCVHFDADQDQALLELHTSTDAGRSWRQWGTLTTPETGAVSLALGADHTALVAGACPARVGDCEPRAPLRIDLGARAEANPVRAADLVGRASGPVFSVDGSRAYFVGLRAKDERPALYVSRDGARSFAAVPMDPPRAATRAGADTPEGAAALWELLGEGALSVRASPGEDGRVGLAFDADVPLYAVCDAEGRVRQLARLPPGTMAVSGAGSAILALVADEAASEGTAPAELWESADGGSRFRRLADAPSLSLEELQSTSDELRQSLQCGVGGCVVGALASRMGWGEPDRAAPVAPPRSPRSAAEPAVLGPLECTVDPASRWQTIRSVHSDSGSVLPTASVLMRGAFAWSVLQYDDETGEATVVGAPADGSGSDLVTHKLLDRAADRSHVALDVAHQMEGYLVARVPMPKKGAVVDAPMRELTVAWLDAYADARGLVTVPIPDRFGPRSVTPGARPGLYGTLLSVAGDRVLASLDTRGREIRLIGAAPTPPSVLAYPEWPAIAPGLRLEEDALIVAGQPMALGWLLEEPRRTAAIGLAPLGPTRADPVFIAVAPPDREEREVTTALSYRGTESGITLHVTAAERASAWASFSPLGPDGRVGQPVALATQASLDERAPGCSAAERRAGARLLAPRVAGRRRPVLVRVDGASSLLLTDAAVIYGTAKAACVAAWSAVGIGSSASGLFGVISGNLRRSWLLRPTPGVRAALDVVPMSCQVATDLPLPSELWAADATHVRHGW